MSSETSSNEQKHTVVGHNDNGIRVMDSKPRVPSRPRSPWFNPTPRCRPKTAGFNRTTFHRKGRPIQQLWAHRGSTSKMGFPLRPSTAQQGRPSTSRRMNRDEYVFTNPEVIVRTMQDRQQQKTGFHTLRLYRDPKAAGGRQHKCAVTSESIQHGLEQQGFDIDKNTVEKVFSMIAGKDHKRVLTGGEFIERLRDARPASEGPLKSGPLRDQRFASSNPHFTSRTNRGHKQQKGVPGFSLLQQIRKPYEKGKVTNNIPNYEPAKNKIKGFSTQQVEKYKRLSRNRARDHYVARHHQVVKEKQKEKVLNRLQKSHRHEFGTARQRGEWQKPTQSRKYSPRTHIKINDRNDRRSGRKSIMTHMFHDSGWDLDHGHGRQL